MQISFSRFSTYRRCPQQYKLQYLDRIPVPAGPELHFGAAVHDALNRMYDPRQLQRPQLEEVIEAFIASWQGRQEEIPEEKRQLYFERGVDLLRRHYERHGAEEEGARTAATELSFSIRLGDSDRLTGRVDRVDVLGEKQLEVIDYKTGARMPTQSVVDRDVQLAIYRLAAAELYPTFDVTTTLYYVLHDVRMSAVQSDEMLSETQYDILEAIARIQLGDFDPNPDSHCDWCGVKAHCELFRKPLETPDLEIDVDDVLRRYAEASEAEAAAKRHKAEAQAQINAYLDQAHTERVEGKGYEAIRRRYRQVVSWDAERVRETLEPLGMWGSVTQVDSAAVKGLLATSDLTREQKAEIEAAAEYRESKRIRLKRLGSPEDPEETAE